MEIKSGLKKRASIAIVALLLIGLFYLSSRVENGETSFNTEGMDWGLSDGTYEVEAVLSGGSGRANIASPAVLTAEAGEYTLQIQWSSPNYDYMKIGDTVFYPLNKEGDSLFEIPVPVFDENFEVIADTTAMSEPHEITYQICLDSSSISAVDDTGTADMTDDTAMADETGLADDTESESDWYREEQRKISDSLSYDHSLELSYASEFAADYYNDGFILISIADGSRFLLNTEGQKVPEDLEPDITVLEQRPEKIYLAASAVMDMFVSCGGLDKIRLSALKEDGWYIREAKEAMQEERIIYAGKYNTPDYERILSEDCDLAVESTMINHAPEVKENLESFNIPVLVDYSSYEEHPLGRTEWVKLYGILTGQEEAAEEAFKEQEEKCGEAVKEAEKTENRKSVVFFYITSNETAVVRKSNDYVPKMIELAGGAYQFKDLEEDGKKTSSVNMQMEEFYAGAKEADVLIYNSTVDGTLSSIDELLEKCSLLSDFKAVQNGNVWCTTQNLYQESMSTGEMIAEIHMALTEEKNHEDLEFLYRLE